MSMDADKNAFAHPQPASKTWRPLLVVVVVAALIAVAAYWLAHRAAAQPPAGGRGGQTGQRGGMPMPVGTATVATGDIRISLNALGTVTSLRNVTVGAQANGQLIDVRFKEGQLVHQGDPLAEIDPRPYQATLTQTEGSMARDQALLAEAKIDLDRYQTLFKEDSIARQQLDAQQSLVHQYEGALKADQGQIATATLNLAYTRITAPVSGRVGLRLVDPGNNVQNGSSIVVITQIQPIDILFTLSEDNLPAVLEKMHAGTTLTTDIYDRAGATKLASGTLASLDNLIDTSTGTIKAKAEVANDNGSLFPNQFVNVRLLLDVLHGATVIPTSALERGAGGLFVYVVQPDKTASVRTIKTGPTEGERVAVTDGLQVGEVVVTSGADRLREGSKVELPGDAPKPVAAAGNAQKTAGGTPAKGHGHGHRGQGQNPSGPNAGSPAASSKPADAGGQ